MFFWGIFLFYVTLGDVAQWLGFEKQAKIPVLLGPEVRHTRFFVNRNNIPKNCDIHCYNRDNFTSQRTILIYIENV